VEFLITFTLTGDLRSIPVLPPPYHTPLLWNCTPEQKNILIAGADHRTIKTSELLFQ